MCWGKVKKYGDPVRIEAASLAEWSSDKGSDTDGVGDGGTVGIDVEDVIGARGDPQFLGDAIGYFEIGDPLGAEALVVGRIIVEATEFIVARFLDVDHERSRLEIGAEEEFRLRTFGEPALIPGNEPGITEERCGGKAGG